MTSLAWHDNQTKEKFCITGDSKAIISIYKIIHAHPNWVAWKMIDLENGIPYGLLEGEVNVYHS